MTALAFGALCFSSLFTVIDPIAVAPVFTSVASGRTRAESRRMALRACLVALGVLVLFAASGAFLFKLFGITIDAFRIGGGIVFLLIGLPMLSSGGPSPREAPPPDGDPSIVPLGVPLIGGPGAITTVMLLMGQSTTTWHTTALFAALLGVLAATYGVMLVAPALIRRLGAGGTALVTKVMGLIIVVVGVQFVIDGLKPVAIDVVRSALGPS